MKITVFLVLVFCLGMANTSLVGEQCYSGIIGVESYHQEQEKFNISAFCDKAKQLGLNYLVFTEDVRHLNEVKWNQLVADCKVNSNETFIAIPGIKYMDSGWKAHFMCFSMQEWINPDCLTPEGLVKDQSGILFGLNWPAMVLCSPSQNGFPPWAVKFYTGFAVFTDKNGELVENALESYLARQGNGYNLFPAAVYSINTLQDLERTSGFRTLVRANKVSEIPLKLKSESRSVFVSNGPLITDWKIENDTGAIPRRPWVLSFSASSTADIKEVIIYDKSSIFRRFVPSGKMFSGTITGWQDKQHYFVMRVVDKDGKEAISSVHTTTNHQHSLGMCRDLQNTIDGANLVVKDTDELVSVGIMGSYVTGWNGGHPGVLVPESELFPEGLDYAVRSFRFSCSGISTTEGNESPVARRDIVFGSGDCTILDSYHESELANNTLVPNQYADMKVRFISFTPRLYSYNPLLIESVMTIKKTLRLADMGGPEIVPITVEGTSDSFENYTYWGADGLLHKGKKNEETSFSSKILKGGYISLWPNFYGSFALYTYDSDQTASVRNTNIRMGMDEPGKELAKGAIYQNKYLLVRDKFGSASDEGFEKLRSVYGFGGKAMCKASLSQGKVLENVFILTLEAKDYCASGMISKADLPNDLPIIVKGLNGNWDAGVYDRKTGEFRRIGIFEGAGYATLDLSNDRDVFIGNLLMCDNPEIKLALTEIDKNGIKLEAHNPTDQAVSITITSSKQLGLFPVVSEKFAINAGEAKIFTVSAAK